MWPCQAAEVAEAAGLLSDLVLLDELSEVEVEEVVPESLLALESLLPLLPFDELDDGAAVVDELVERLSVR